METTNKKSGLLFVLVGLALGVFPLVITLWNRTMFFNMFREGQYLKQDYLIIPGIALVALVYLLVVHVKFSAGLLKNPLAFGAGLAALIAFGLPLLLNSAYIRYRVIKFEQEVVSLKITSYDTPRAGFPWRDFRDRRVGEYLIRDRELIETMADRRDFTSPGKKAIIQSYLRRTAQLYIGLRLAGLSDAAILDRPDGPNLLAGALAWSEDPAPFFLMEGVQMVWREKFGEADPIDLKLRPELARRVLTGFNKRDEFIQPVLVYLTLLNAYRLPASLISGVLDSWFEILENKKVYRDLPRRTRGEWVRTCQALKNSFPGDTLYVRYRKENESSFDMQTQHYKAEYPYVRWSRGLRAYLAGCGYRILRAGEGTPASRTLVLKLDPEERSLYTYNMTRYKTVTRRVQERRRVGGSHNYYTTTRTESKRVPDGSDERSYNLKMLDLVLQGPGLTYKITVPSFLWRDELYDTKKKTYTVKDYSSWVLGLSEFFFAYPLNHWSR